MPNRPLVPVISTDDAGNEVRYPSIKAAVEAVRGDAAPDIDRLCHRVSVPRKALEKGRRR